MRQRRGARHLLWLMAGPRRRLSEVTVPSRAQPLFHAGVLRRVFARYLLSTGLGRCVTPSPPAPAHPVLIGSWHCCRAGCDQLTGCDDERESTPRRFFYFRLQAFPLTACFFTTPFRRPYGRGRCRARRPARQRACAPAGADPRLFQTCATGVNSWLTRLREAQFLRLRCVIGPTGLLQRRQLRPAGTNFRAAGCRVPAAQPERAQRRRRQ